MPEHFRFLSFDILKEPWNVYRLGDGTILKARFILHKIRAESEPSGVTKAVLGQSPFLVAEVPDQLYGPPGSRDDYSSEEVDAALVDADVKVEPVKEDSSIYLLENQTILSAKVTVTRVGRTSLYGRDGEPRYKIETKAEIRFFPTAPPTGDARARSTEDPSPEPESDGAPAG